MTKELLSKAVRLFDFRREQCCWGHSCSWGKPTPGHLRIHGWCNPRPQNGDLLLIEESDGNICLYRADSADYPQDPPDMFFVNCTFLPGSHSSKEVNLAVERLVEGTAKVISAEIGEYEEENKQDDR